MSKILFIYPNSEGYPIIPLAISTLSGILKYKGHETDLFDTTFMQPVHADHEARIKTGLVAPVDMGSVWDGATANPAISLIAKIKQFRPDIIAFTIVENTYKQAMQLISEARQTTPYAIIIVGGLFPTIMPQFFINNPDIDLICTGEGENVLNTLAFRFRRYYSCADIPNLTFKRDGIFYKNNPGPYYNWECPAFQDWKIFDQRHLLKPFMGKIYRTGFFELSRGCPHKCAYCTNDLCQQIFKSLGNYNRQKPLWLALDEIAYMKRKYALELVFFNDENFLTMSNDRFNDFCKQYQARIGLPFFIMTRANNLLDQVKIGKLKDAGCVTIGIGVESGNEDIRKHVLNKNLGNDVFVKAFHNCRQFGIRTTANIMIGLPFENEQNIIESAEFCIHLQADSVSLAIFAPYYGTELRKICIDWHYMEDRLYDDIGIINRSILTMPQISADKISEMYYKFNELVYG